MSTGRTHRGLSGNMAGNPEDEDKPGYVGSQEGLGSQIHHLLLTSLQDKALGGWFSFFPDSKAQEQQEVQEASRIVGFFYSFPLPSALPQSDSGVYRQARSHTVPICPVVPHGCASLRDLSSFSLVWKGLSKPRTAQNKSLIVSIAR